MKKRKRILVVLAALMAATPLYAYEGEMGYFGGITPGYKLPTTTALAQEKAKKPSKVVLPYKETVYLTGKPVTVEGTMEFRPQVVDKTKPVGTYTENYVMKAEDKGTQSKLTRTLTLDTQYVYDPVARQTTKTSEVKKWTELISIGGTTYQLDFRNSEFSKSMLEDHTPGVTYYRGDLAYAAVYNNVTAGGGAQATVSVSGPIYGYDHAYAKTETQKRTITIEDGTNNYFIEEMPTFTTYKELQYGANEPWAISFGGNYKEVLRGDGTVMYNVQVGHPGLYDNEKIGTVGIADTPSIEQLRAVELSHMKGHPAESDIRKMYALQIFTGDPTKMSPNQVVTRGQYIEMLVRALKLPLPEVEKKKTVSSKKDEVEIIVFTDIKKDDPLYPYALAAYNAGLIGNGRVNPGTYLTREEMLAMNVRAIGLERLGIATSGMVTPFLDDNLISDWAKSPVYAASRIGLVDTTNGYLLPQRKVTQAEAAAFMNRLLEYLRYELQKDYQVVALN
ncbi:MAG: S-layer homology domain-containing protein [Cellulosilyticaceae bacterium]